MYQKTTSPESVFLPMKSIFKHFFSLHQQVAYDIRFAEWRKHLMQESANALYKLPTTREIAEKGVAEYVSLLSTLSPKARFVLISSVDIRPLAAQGVPFFVTIAGHRPPDKSPTYSNGLHVQRCFVGISPEIRFEYHDIAAYSREAFEALLRQLNEYSQNFFLYHKESQNPLHEMYHLFNLSAVRHVAANYPACFPSPEMLTHTKEWLQNNGKFWADGGGINCIRYGLLSGFPLDSAIKFSLYRRIDRKLETDQTLTHEEQELRQIAHSAYSRRTALSYWGFDVEKNNEYLRQIDEIYQESGITLLDLCRFQPK
jgi:hypothetical protein